MGPLARLGLRFRRGFGQITPDPFVLAVFLSLAVLLAAVVIGDWPGTSADSLATRVTHGLQSWAGTGLWKLLAFAMQATLMLVVGTALAEAPIIRRGIRALAGLARSPRMLVGLTAFVSIALSLISWSLSLIGGALLAREAGRVAAGRGWRLHYPLLCAAAYTGLMVWHGGLSGTAPLKATSEKDLVEVLGPELAAQVGVIPLGETLFSPLNLVITLGLLVLGTLLFTAFTPVDGQDPDPQSPPATERENADPIELPPADRIEALERSPIVIWALAVPMLAGWVLIMSDRGIGQLDLDMMNLGLWIAAMLLHGRPDRFLAACEKGVRGCLGIVLQFPLYAGIMAVMAASGLSAMLSQLIVQTGPELLGLITFLSAGALNLFVPSGGGQWAVQGPIAMQAALDSGVEPATLLMAVAYGDQWTNMVQPFWAIPLLAVTGVRARDIVGYTCLWMLFGGAWIALGIVWLG